MRTFHLALVILTTFGATAIADEHHHDPRPASAPRGHEAGPRYRGEVVHTTNRVVVKNQAAPRAVINERRRPAEIERDAHIRFAVRGYHPQHSWGHYHPASGGWFGVFGIRSWNAVETVTCEAANEQTGEMFPVAQDRDSRGWNDTTVDAVLDQALDDCAAEAGANVCVPAQPACSYQ